MSIGRVLLLRAGGVPALLRDTGEPALTRRAVGKGQVYYLGACFSEKMVRRLLTDPSL
ncbi:beta-galactosidase trimerization domain-containing protein [Actinomyces urogenitalis]|uniref:beta-galactosidase trimerization domain-containing protein n=1 Tax=Actinomyces urogenitalis TaxID=103621 RepID=UPI000A7DB476|nr:beta-galactosidase trimerization domain-containing protein [Actinomyces urogenitalis]MDK8237980.1 beta-galactosidase trimerization domain-containing protein [Actinomyces urogenitalis]MDU0865089.1 beta-galactosidase trimerization domain-containing protein [Actinomyces urogenitalis]MDU0875541.1 beta-galactosidase trimerization domain-containing protein [Actinomyces urogenitalis]MDU5427149.1 beta-galactosidase trimerization domain-containing protein [Actinomyces urogenitalis]MDU5874280.1 beta-